METKPNPEFTAAWALDRRLAKGARVEVRWTSAGRFFRGTGTVAKVNAKSVRVTLDAAVEPYPAGFAVSAPRINTTPWSYSNGVFEVERPKLPLKRGKITAIEHGRQTVVTDDGETFHLTPGHDAARGGRVGDRVELEYRSTPRLGLWYGRVIPLSPFSRRCQCGTEYVPKTIADGYCPTCMEARKS